MEFADSAEEGRFRAGLRAWLADRLPVPPGEWAARLHDAGYAGLSWPREYGGGGLPPHYQVIFLEECARAGAPPHPNVIGLEMAGPTLLAFGSEDQKARFLGGILRDEIVFCQGFSEPEAGSDLAALRTRAVRDGDGYRVTGTKLWSSHADRADWCLLLCRTGSEPSGHRGLTCLLVDMAAPGVTVRPLRQLTGRAEFSELVFEDVTVPAEQVVGGEGNGWRVAMTTLEHERGTHAFALAAKAEALFGRLVDTARRTGADRDRVLLDRLGALRIDLDALRFTNYRVLTSLLRTGRAGPESTITKLHWSETNQRLTALALDLLGTEARLAGEWTHQHLRSRGNSIEGGTSEILRSVVAERVLGLPRSR